MKSTQPVTNEPIGYQLNASGYSFVLSHLRILKSAKDNTLFRQSFEKDYWAFCDFEFSRSQLINIHEKIGTREKSPDNRIVRIIEVRLYFSASVRSDINMSISDLIQPMKS